MTLPWPPMAQRTLPTRRKPASLFKPGAKALVIAAKDPLLAGADGLAFGEKTVLNVNSVTTGKLLRVDLGPDGKSTSVTELKLSKALTRPDGMRAIGKNRLLLAENSGNMDIVTFSGPGGQDAEIKTIKEGLESTPAVTATRSMAWIAEGKLNYRSDPELKGKDPGNIQNLRCSGAQKITGKSCKGIPHPACRPWLAAASAGR
jgi:hypothetical protein